MIKGLEKIDKIAFDPIKHAYTNKLTGRPYLSVSRFIDLFAEKFDKENISKAVAKKRGVSQATILAEWDKTRDDAIDHGNRLHDALELYDKTTHIDPSNYDIKDIIISIASMYKDYYRKSLEQRLCSDKYEICGTTDKLLKLTSHPRSLVDIDDYKTNLSKGIQYHSKYNKYLLGPLSHLQDCNYNRYSIQLSMYAYMYEEMTGLRVRKLSILFIPGQDLLAYRRIPVPYMKKEVEAMLSWYEQNVMKRKEASGFNLTA